MQKIVFGLLLLLSAGISWSAEPHDYLAERRALAASEDYDPDSLTLMHKVLLDEHYKRGADSKMPIAEVNEPLYKLSEMYPLGIQVNQAVAGFLEYLVKQSVGVDDADLKDTLEIAKGKRAKADAILASILSTGNGETRDTAFEVINIIEEYAVLEHFKFERIDQVLYTDTQKTFDILKVKAADGTEKSVYFDITLFYGKKPARKEPAAKQ